MVLSLFTKENHLQKKVTLKDFFQITDKAHMRICVFFIFLISFTLLSQDIKSIVNAKLYDNIVYDFCEKKECQTKVKIEDQLFIFDDTSLDPKEYEIFQMREKMGIKNPKEISIERYGVIVEPSKSFKLIQKGQATINICHKKNPRELGCADKILLNGEETLADFSLVKVDESMTDQREVFVIGYYDIEDGHNPTKKQHIFKVFAIEFDHEVVDKKVSDISREFQEIYDKKNEAQKKKFLVNQK